MLFSIITVTYNCKDTIEKTIRSVISQKNVEFEYIIIDGASTDGTKELINEYSEHLSHFISEKDAGIYDAMNKGVKLSRGDVVAFLNSGDWYEPNVLKLVAEEFARKESDIVYGRVNKICKGEIVGSVGLSEEYEPDDLHKGNIYCHQGLFIKKHLFDEVGLYNTRYKTLADYDWNLRAYNAGIEFTVLPEVVANYVDGGYSTSSLTSPMEYYEISMRNIGRKHIFVDYIENEFEIRKENRGLEILIKEKHIIDRFKPSSRDVYIWGAGYNGELCYRLYKECGYNVVAYIDTNPRRYKKSEVKVGTFDDIRRMYDGEDIIITPRIYDNDIKQFVIRKGIDEKHIIMFCDLLREAGRYYEDRISQDELWD